MKFLALAFCFLWPLAALGQSLTVLPEELEISVTLDDPDQTPFAREMVLITIRGVYRRHITRENLVQPDLEGFSWAQLGPDTWRDERLDGKKVKVLTRRMAVYPDAPGTLTIGAFTHELTLTDEVDEWFAHKIYSEPLTLTVAPQPVQSDWWFPVRALKVSDSWSNAPDQLADGEGVLRIVQLEALGVTPEMIPPMPELTSPSALIFPHPEKRLVELTPHGPVTYAYWRWTIRPSNDTSTIVEPLSFEYFDTSVREPRSVTISAQRVAYGDVVPQSKKAASQQRLAPVELPGWQFALVGGLVFAGSAFFLMTGRNLDQTALRQRLPMFDPLLRKMRRAARKGDGFEVRRVASAIVLRDGDGSERQRLLKKLDCALFDPNGKRPDLRLFARDFQVNDSSAQS